MSLQDEHEFAAFVSGDTWYWQVTAAAVDAKLQDFPLSLAEGKDMAWLATAVRRSMAISTNNKQDGPDRTSNAEVRGEITRLTDIAAQSWLELFQLKDEVRRHLFLTSFFDEVDKEDLVDLSDYARFNRAVAELDWVSGYLRRAARKIQSQQGAWRAKERKHNRVMRARYLAPIFEAAFGHNVTANNNPSDARHREPTAFMEFYRRMIELTFGKHEAANLADVLKEACKLHRRDPVKFYPNVIPGLSGAEVDDGEG